MQGRVSSVEQEDLGFRGPLVGLFLRFNRNPVTYSLREALREVSEQSLSGNLPFHPEELNTMIEVCEDMGRALSLERGERLNVAEIASVALYTAQFYASESMFDILNRFLREKNRQALKPFVEYIWLLMWGLRKMPAYEGRTVFRGVKRALRDQYTRGNTICWYQFSSCSNDIEVQQSEQFTGRAGDRTLFSIELTTPRARMIQRYSLLPSEQEVLLPPNSMFEIVGVLDAGNGMALIQMREVAPRDPILIFDDPSPAPAPAPDRGVELRICDNRDQLRHQLLFNNKRDGIVDLNTALSNIFNIPSSVQVEIFLTSRDGIVGDSVLIHSDANCQTLRKGDCLRVNFCDVCVVQHRSGNPTRSDTTTGGGLITLNLQSLGLAIMLSVMHASILT